MGLLKIHVFCDGTLCHMVIWLLTFRRIVVSSSVPDVQGEGAMIVCQEIVTYGHDVTSQTEIYIFCLHDFLGI